MEKHKQIIIAGAGFAGILAAKKLSRVLRNANLTLIDKENYQLFVPNLYEVATSDEDLTTIGQLKKSIALPFAEIIAGTGVNFLKAEVSRIDIEAKTLQAGDKSLSYDYLVLSLGSESDYFNIPGAKEFSLALKTLPDALRIRNRLEFILQTHRQDSRKPNIKLVIAGGGYTGVEFAAELADEIQYLAWKNQYLHEKIELLIIEGTNQLIPGLSDRMSKDALYRLNNLGVIIQFSSMITQVEEHFVELNTGERLEYDLLVWTTGVKARPLPFTSEVACDRKGRAETSKFLQLSSCSEIFVLGDQACVMDQNQHPAPPTAQDAMDQASYIAYALPLIISGKEPHPYQVKKHGFIVTMGGKWAILNYPPFYFKGFLAYVIRAAANFRYYGRVVGWWKAFKYLILQLEIYSRND